jgi:hypothetical protein
MTTGCPGAEIGFLARLQMIWQEPAEVHQEVHHEHWQMMLLWQVAEAEGAGWVVDYEGMVAYSAAEICAYMTSV